jgi:hypothetical protein
MFSRVRDRFGTAGLVVAIVALVAALGGTAYAANAALSGKQKKEVEKISKKFAGKPGAPGAAGTPGPAGAPGAKGDTGAKGGDGVPGANGKTVVIGSTAPGCGSPGGKTIEVAGEPGTKQNICNGNSAEFPEALPSGKTETGTWGALATKEGPGAVVALPFNIPMPHTLDAAHVVKLPEVYNGEDEAGTEHENCPGTSENPRAKEGFLCVYIGNAIGASSIESIFNPNEGLFGPAGAANTGAALFLTATAGTEIIISGTYAVTSDE